MTLKLKDLNREALKNAESSYIFDLDQPSYDKAFLKHIQCAQALYKASLFRESYLTYLLALECLLKDIFCLARDKMFGPDPRLSQPILLICSADEKPQERSTKLIDSLKAYHFGHNLPLLNATIKKLFPEIENETGRFAKLSIAADDKLKMESERYKDPDEFNSAYWEEKTTKIDAALKMFVKSDLNNIYPEAYNE